MDAHARTQHCTLHSITAPGFWRILGLALLSWATLTPDVEAQSCPSIDPNQNYNCAIGPIYAMPGWGNVPWSLPQYYQDILLGDLDGDGRDELIGRDAFGVHVWSFDTTLGTWRPWLSTNDTGVLLLPLSDASGWNQPQYYATLQLMNLPGKPGKILAARGPAGLVLFQLIPGVGPVPDFPAGQWTTLTQGGPFADADCFTNAKCWNAAPYYQTIRFGDIDGDPGDEVIGWGGDGIVAFKWNGTQWTGITGLPRAGDAVPAGPSAYLTLRFADVDGEAGQELLDWSVGGVTVLKYVPGKGGSWTELSPITNFGDPPCHTGNVSCWSTLQPARFGVDGVAMFMRLPGCSGNGGGMAGAVYDPNAKQWRPLFSGGPFDDCSGFTKPQYYETIQLAYITGNVVPELVGRGPGGILVYQWNGTSWVPLSTNVPALSDPLWASDPSYWRTIKTGFIEGEGQQALLARGQTGIRTWLYRGGTLERPLPTGEAAFPPFTGAQGDAYAKLNTNVMKLGHPVRDSYANPSFDTTSSTLRSYISPTIVAAGNGCRDEISANPPQYRTCDPSLAGATNPAYTQVVNQVIRELWFAAAVIDYFSTLTEMQNAQFLVEGSTFPSIADNLQFSQADGQTTSTDYLGLFASIAEFLTSFPGFTEFAPLADAMAVLASSTALFQTPQNSVFQQTYDDIQGQIASQQQAAQTNLLAQKHYVLSDYGMLSTAGQLISSQEWTLDKAAYLSASRLAFATWVYQAFLPLFWEQYQVTNCMDFFVGDVTCTPPPDGAYMASYSAGGVNFNGLLPPQTPCQPKCSGEPPSCQTTCTFATPAAALTSMVFDPLLPACQYSPGSGNAWIYPAPGKAGCTLAAGPGIFANLNGWTFQVVPYNVGSWSLAIDNASRVRGIGKTGASSDVRIKGHTTLPQDLDLRTTRIALSRIVREAAGAEELINDGSGNTITPISLAVDRRATASDATLTSGPGASPRIRADLKYNAKRRDLKLDVSIDGGTLVSPELCMGEPPTTRLAIELELRDATHRELLLGQVADWLCEMDRHGNVTALRPAGAPTFGTP